MYEDYLKHTSSEITEDIEKFTTDEVFKSSRYIFTTRIDKKEKGYCTHCKAEFKTNKLKHNSDYICPSCGSNCTVKQAWRGHKGLHDQACFVYYMKSNVDPNIIIAKGFYAVRNYNGDYKNAYNQYSLEALYVFDINENTSKMFKRTWYGCTEFVETKSIYNFNINSLARHPFFCSYESIEKTVVDTGFKYSPYKEYFDGSMVNFFSLYTKYPIVEQITKVGLRSLIDSKLSGWETYKAINWRGKDIYKMLKINRKDLKNFKESEVLVSPLFLKLYQLSQKDKANLTPKEVKSIESLVSGNIDNFFGILKYVTFTKTCNYIKKQQNIIRKEFYINIIITWKDYIADCIKLGMDLTSDNVLFPKDIYAAHQNTIKQIKIIADVSLNFAISKRLKSLNKYIFECKGLLIRPAQGSTELIEEGKALSHCVGGYADRYAKGDTNILFIRKTSEPDTSYYTIEIRKDIIIQIHGKNNRSATEDVKEFIEIFTEEKLTKKTKEIKIKIPA